MTRIIFLVYYVKLSTFLGFLQQIQPLNDGRVTDTCAGLRERASELETREEKIAEFLSTLRHVLRSIQELKHISQEENEGFGNIQDIEVCFID